MAIIMVQGTGSSVGKSVITAALCRIFHQDGYKVVPYKSQNMSNNSFATIEGEEMGRAQVLQAHAAGIRPRSIMNPILIKPTSDTNAQLIVNGKVHGDFSATEYEKLKPGFREMIKSQLEELQKDYDIVVVEGAGSPAEINLRKNDIVNMGLATMVNCPVILVGDIDKGGVFASLYGTVKLVSQQESDLIAGTLINKFRGDITLLNPGVKMLEDLTGKPNLGVVPYFRLNLEEEDGEISYKRNADKPVDVAVLLFPHLSNHSDIEALKCEEDVSVRFVSRPEQLGNPDMLILPGSKSTIYDLEWMKKTGLFEKVKSLKNTIIVGICGGYQMMGNSVSDPLGLEGPQEYSQGLGLIPMTTVMQGEKTVRQIEGSLLNDSMKKVYGYEIHMGESRYEREPKRLLALDGPEGYISEDGNVIGTYLHGIFDSKDFREHILGEIRNRKGLEKRDSIDFIRLREESLDALADVVRENINLESIYGILKLQK